MVLGSQPRRVGDVLDPAVTQLGGLDGRIPPPVALLERVEEPLHHPFDFRGIADHVILAEAITQNKADIIREARSGSYSRPIPKGIYDPRGPGATPASSPASARSSPEAPGLPALPRTLRTAYR